MARITFLGAAGTVTGSRYLVEAGRSRVLVDCGLFQGLKRLRERNWADPGFDPASLDAIVLTHAHLDHSGYLPRLWRLGYRGPVHCTEGTRDLLQVLLPDAGHLQEDEARFINRAGYSKHRPALPLFTREEAEASLGLLQAHPFHADFAPAEGVHARFTRAGHILGAASLRLEAEGRSILFTGDVGRPEDPVMRAPEPPPACDTLVVESTYGDRRHPEEDTAGRLAAAVREAAAKGGVVLVPAFAVGRAQGVLQLLADLRHTGAIPDIPVFLDSPMAIRATDLFLRHREDHRLDDAATARMYELADFTRTPEESKALDRRSGPMVLLSASGMATGGRILHHLKRFLPDPASVVLLVGFQAAGTRGRSLADGADEVKIFGDYVPVRAKVIQLEGLSAHADYAELMAWLKGGGLAPKRVFVTHGEASAADAFRRRLKDSFGWDAVVPEEGSAWSLGPA